MDYYLYSHSNSNGIFYIGKGCGGRKDRYDRRSQEWYKASKNGYTTKIEANGSEKDILALEGKVIKSLIEQGVKLVNKFNNKNWDGFKGENNNFFGKIHSKKTKKQMSGAQSGENNGMFGKAMSDEAKQKISEYRLGKKHSEKTKKQMSESRLGEGNGMYGKKNPRGTLANNKRWQRYRFDKANNFANRLLKTAYGL